MLNDIEYMPSHLWAAGKIYFYSKINTPFIHFDGDFIVGNKFNLSLGEIINKNNLITEFFYSEIFSNLYTRLLSEITKSKKINLPDYFRTFIEEENFNMSYYNLGIIRSDKLRVFNDYGNGSLNFINENIHNFEFSNLPIDF